MARTNSDDMLMEEELAELFQSSSPESSSIVDSSDKSALYVEPSDGGDDGWDNTDDFPWQLAVDVY